MRNATAYGVSPRLRCDIVLNDLVGAAHTSGRILVRSDGTPWRPLVHVADIAQAALAALTAPREVVHGQAFNVGRTDENFRVSEIAEIVREAVPSARVEYAAGAGPDKRSYRVSFEKIRRLVPGFRPAWTVRAGARELADAYRTRGYSQDDHEGARYRRVGRFRAGLESGRLEATLRLRAEG
jgi:nucleoside-diphosphate-sugar epimerase